MYTADMGAESVWTHSINHETGEITVVLEDKIEGHEPRHVVAHPSGKYAYAMTEPTSSVIELSVDNSTGAATHTGAIYGIVPASKSFSSTTRKTSHVLRLSQMLMMYASRCQRYSPR